jgi:hypothetical protein
MPAFSSSRADRGGPRTRGLRVVLDRDVLAAQAREVAANRARSVGRGAARRWCSTTRVEDLETTGHGTPVRQRAEASTGGGPPMCADARAVDVAADQAGLLEHLQVLGDGRLGQRQPSTMSHTQVVRWASSRRMRSRAVTRGLAPRGERPPRLRGAASGSGTRPERSGRVVGASSYFYDRPAEARRAGIRGYADVATAVVRSPTRGTARPARRQGRRTCVGYRASRARRGERPACARAANRRDREARAPSGKDERAPATGPRVRGGGSGP